MVTKSIATDGDSDANFTSCIMASCLFARFLNIGSSKEVSIHDFAQFIAEITRHRGAPVFDTSRPDGPPRKLLDVTKLTALGWTAKTPLRERLHAAYADFPAIAGAYASARRQCVALPG